MSDRYIRIAVCDECNEKKRVRIEWRTYYDPEGKYSYQEAWYICEACDE